MDMAYTYEDMWNRAIFELYYKPYLIPVGIVLIFLILGIVLLFIRRKYIMK